MKSMWTKLFEAAVTFTLVSIVGLNVWMVRSLHAHETEITVLHAWKAEIPGRMEREKEALRRQAVDDAVKELRPTLDAINAKLDRMLEALAKHVGGQ
jgi:hypothetical protein